ncbi:hypothetical protein FIBSPDRAFT_957191 [Athelia psychrophila]|uniref:Uncharacterized protein n=1 Tax=Athelia psychrophila TaxID=1759441 RepID=A0A166G185_9AGAM|nr:hypothetical protein FIBSPDRAFT_957191 [Fibularhizoctonia sp. CBS 109695]
MPSLEVMEATVSGLAARAKFPSVSTLAISFVVTVLLLVLVRAAFNRLATSHYVAVSTSDNDEKDNRTDNESAQSGPTNRSRWSWSWRWQGLRLSLPVSLTISEKDHPETGAGMGVAAALRQQQQQMQQRPMIWHAPRQRSPGFEAPLPALYDTPVPVSAAKLIMARHTYRRPNPPRASATSKPKVSRSRSAPPPARPIPIPSPRRVSP